MSYTVRMLVLPVLLVVVAVVTVMAHLAPTKTMPDTDAVITESPNHIQVWFTQDPDPAVSQLSLDGPTGTVELGKTTVVSEKSLMAVVPVSYTHLTLPTKA